MWNFFFDLTLVFSKFSDNIMHSTTSCIKLTALLVWLARAAPVAEPQVVTITVIPIQATAAASAYPKPTTNEFKYFNYDENSNEDKGDRFMVHSAFLPFAKILQAGVDAVADTADDTYKRWFPEKVDQPHGKPQVDSRDYVGSVYRRLLAPGANPTPQPRVKDLIHDNKDFANDCDPDDQAYMVGAYGQFHVCKPEGLLNQPMIADPANCSSLGALVSDDMDSLSGTLIHEFMH